MLRNSPISSNCTFRMKIAKSILRTRWGSIEGVKWKEIFGEIFSPDTYWLGLEIWHSRLKSLDSSEILVFLQKPLVFLKTNTPQLNKSTVQHSKKCTLTKVGRISKPDFITIIITFWRQASQVNFLTFSGGRGRCSCGGCGRWWPLMDSGKKGTASGGRGWGRTLHFWWGAIRWARLSWFNLICVHNSFPI